MVSKCQETAEKRCAVPQFELLPLTFTLMARVTISNGEIEIRSFLKAQKCCLSNSIQKPPLRAYTETKIMFF